MEGLYYYNIYDSDVYLLQHHSESNLKMKVTVIKAGIARHTVKNTKDHLSYSSYLSDRIYTLIMRKIV